jgi:hypothetical protein
VKLLSKTEQHLAFDLNALETQLLSFTLASYPMAHEPWSVPPAAREKTNRRPAAPSPDPELLSATLGEMKEAHRSRLEAFLSGPGLQQQPDGGSRLVLPLADVDWFMQVVNELRVASWYRLDCPEQHEEAAIEKHPERLHDFLRMDFSGMLLDGILRALDAADE